MRRNIFNLGMLFASKSGAILVGIFFLPWFNRLLGEELFGIVAVILSFQALLIMLDLGMATLVARDVAARDSMDNNSHALMLWRHSEIVLNCFYVLLLFAGLCWYNLYGPVLLSASSVLGIVVLFWTLVLQNVAQSALVAARSYILSSCIQIAGVLTRAIVTLLALEYVSPALDVFIWAQVCVSSVHWIVSRIFCQHKLKSFGDRSLDQKIQFPEVLSLLKRGKPLLLAGMAGAAVMQLDKSIILYFMEPADVGAYFLAGSFAMLPLFVLAGPVTQFFQPQITEAIAEKNYTLSRVLIIKFSVVLFFLVAVPSMIIWGFRDSIIVIWLQDAVLAESVSEYVSILMLGAIIGAFGYIPYVILTALQDFVFQAKLSVFLTVITLLFVVLAAYMKHIEWICWAYVFYYAAAAALWGRRSWLSMRYLKVSQQKGL